MKKKKKELNDSLWLGLYSSFLETRYEYYKIYVKNISTHITNEIVRYDQMIAQEEKEKGIIKVLFKSFLHDINKASIPKYFHNSTHAFIYSRFESDFNEICKMVKKALKNVPGKKRLDVKQNIDNNRKFLINEVNINMSQLEIEWQVIKKHQKVRHAIVHDDSNIVRDTSKPVKGQVLYPILKGETSINLDIKFGEFYIENPEYLYEFCDACSSFISKTVELIEEKMKQY